MDEIEEIENRLNYLEEREKASQKEFEEFKKQHWTIQMGSRLIGLKESQKACLISRYDIKKEDSEAIFQDYWDMLINDKVKNIIEFTKLKGISKKPEKVNKLAES